MMEAEIKFASRTVEYNGVEFAVLKEVGQFLYVQPIGD